MRHLKWIVGVLVVLSLIALFAQSLVEARRRSDQEKGATEYANTLHRSLPEWQAKRVRERQWRAAGEPPWRDPNLRQRLHPEPKKVGRPASGR
jgi:hypothetical protein